MIRRICCVLALLSGVWFSIANQVSEAQPALVHLRLSAAPVDDVAPVLYAAASGMFQAAGLDVELHALSNGSAIAAAVAGGSVDIGMSSVLPLISAHARGFPLTLVGPSGIFISTQDVNGGLVVLKDSPIRTARDLNGQIVSVPGLSDLQSIATRSWIEKNGGDPQSISFVEIQQGAVAATLDSARIAAGTLSNPFLASTLATKKYRLLGAVLPAIAPRLLMAAWFASSDFAAKNPATIRKFAAVLQKASAYCNAHPQQTVDLVAKFTGIDASTVAHMVRDEYPSKVDPRDIQPLIDAAAKYKVIAKTFDAQEIISEYAIK